MAKNSNNAIIDTKEEEAQDIDIMLLKDWLGKKETYIGECAAKFEKKNFTVEQYTVELNTLISELGKFSESLNNSDGKIGKLVNNLRGRLQVKIHTLKSFQNTTSSRANFFIKDPQKFSEDFKRSLTETLGNFILNARSYLPIFLEGKASEIITQYLSKEINLDILLSNLTEIYNLQKKGSHCSKLVQNASFRAMDLTSIRANLAKLEQDEEKSKLDKVKKVSSLKFNLELLENSEQEASPVIKNKILELKKSLEREKSGLDKRLFVRFEGLTKMEENLTGELYSIGEQLERNKMENSIVEDDNEEDSDIEMEMELDDTPTSKEREKSSAPEPRKISSNSNSQQNACLPMFNNSRAVNRTNNNSNNSNNGATTNSYCHFNQRGTFRR